VPALQYTIALARRLERWVFLTLLFLFIGSVLIVLWLFYQEFTELVPSPGGTYIEGSVGEFQPLSPWFTVQNDVNRDIVSLVFSGLLRYNPQTKAIEEDLAKLSISGDGRIYTFTLRENLYWHDSTPENPHPVTPEDVLFTFTTIQDPAFPNAILRQNFEGVEIEKVSARSVRFRLEQPYGFFPSTLTLGLLPARSFQGIPLSKLREATDFGFHPIGAGAYTFRSLVTTERSTEVTLERFPRGDDDSYRLERIILRIFPDYPSLLSDIRNLDAVRIVPRNENGDPIAPRQFRVSQYTLPQYVALFLNLDQPILRDPSLRLGLQLGTNKQAIADLLHEPVIVDTPLLEIDTSDWRYQYDPQAAQGALFESNWYLPEKVRLQRLLERHEANSIGPLRIDPIVLFDTGATLTVTGSLSIANTGATLNGSPLRAHPTRSGAWIATLQTSGTGSLQVGDNIVRLIARNGTIIDSAYVWRTTSNAEYRRAAEEQRLLDAFLHSRKGNLSVEERISVSDFILERGMLRRRTTADPRDVRISDKGERLSLTLVTSPSPPAYAIVAKEIERQWRDLGVHINVVIPETMEEFEQRLLRRNYDLLLFGQSLLDNLDSYPYWHSSGRQVQADNERTLRLDAYNLSQYASQRVDQLLEVIRSTASEKDRATTLAELRDIIKKDVPAIFLYSPLYTFAFSTDVSGVELGMLSLHSDRFLTLRQWYVRQERRFREGQNWWSFFPWLASGMR
jgi:ABC-type transport system substrate-binding protein